MSDSVILIIICFSIACLLVAAFSWGHYLGSRKGFKVIDRFFEK